MSDIDWSKAPDGATHFNLTQCMHVRCHRWMKQSAEGEWFFHRTDDNEWVRQPDKFPSAEETLVARPGWNGVGLPPVGAVCEFMCTARGKESEWQPALVKYASPFTVVLDDYSATAGELEGEFVAHPDTMRFRPIRTPEQIVAELREKEIEEMLKGTPWPGSDIGRRVCEHLHAQGYRKQEQPK